MRHQFVAIDVETANADLASICQIGVVTFMEGEVVGAWKTLIDPEDEFAGVNVSIHGIDEQMVVGAPRFPDIVDSMHTLLAGHVVVSHMPFDRVALGRVHERYRLPALQCTWLDYGSCDAPRMAAVLPAGLWPC